MHVSKQVAAAFQERQAAVLHLIETSGISFLEAGIFGSYARNDYKSTSDIDFCIITETKPDRRTSGSLREEADMLGADIIFVTPDYFQNNNTEFAFKLRRDYRRLL